MHTLTCLHEALVDDHCVDVLLGTIWPGLQKSGLGDEANTLEAELVPQAERRDVV